MYSRTIQLEKMNDKETWKKLRNDVRIYELKLPTFEKLQKIKGTAIVWKEKPKEFARYNESADILQVAEIWVNSKGTVMALIAGEGMFTIFSRKEKANGWRSLPINTYDDEHPADFFDKIGVGTWLVCGNRYSSSTRKELFFVTNEATAEDTKIMLDILSAMQKTLRETSEFHWQDENEIKTGGMVTQGEVLRQSVIFYQILRRFKWCKRKNRWDLWNSVKANLSLKKVNGKFKVRLTGLDGKVWTLECPIIQDEAEGYRDSTLFDMDWWLPFVYRQPDDNFLKQTSAFKTSDLMSRFLRILGKLPKATYTLGFNGRKIRVGHKTTSSKALLGYLAGKVVKHEDMRVKLENYFISGTPIIPSPPPPTLGVKGTTGKMVRPMSEEATKLIESGLNGSLRDLEGEFPFHLNILYKPKIRKWFLEIAGKEFHIKGGYNALDRVKSAITGSANLNRDTEGYEDKGTKGIRKRLADLVGEKEALWIILQVKKMGALMKAIGGEV